MPLFLLAELLKENLLHEGVAGSGDVNSVGGEVGRESAGLGDVVIVEVYVGYALFLSKSFQFVIQVLYKRSRVDGLVPAEVVGREDGPEDDANFRSLGLVNHGSDVLRDVLVGDVALVLGDVVDAAEDADCIRIKINYIGVEPAENLSCNLTADAGSDKSVLLKKFRALLFPLLSDGVAHKHARRTIVGW